MVVPVPSGASRVGRLGVVESREDTGSVLEVVSLEAGQTVSILIIGGALIRNWHANLVGIEGPSLGAGQTNLIIPIPCGTS